MDKHNNDVGMVAPRSDRCVGVLVVVVIVRNVMIVVFLLVLLRSVQLVVFESFLLRSFGQKDDVSYT